MSTFLTISGTNVEDGSKFLIVKEVMTGGTHPSSISVAGPARNHEGSLIQADNPHVETYSLEGVDSVLLMDGADIEAALAASKP